MFWRQIFVERKLGAEKDKEVNQLCLRIEIINYILQNIKNFNGGENNVNLFELLNTFFDKFFFRFLPKNRIYGFPRVLNTNLNSVFV